ncbi:MAG: hypothetical protein AB8C46_19620 [Burkholderiaceae bacterium]
MSANQYGAVMVAMLFTATSLLFANAITAPVHAWVIGSHNPFWLWGASFVHIDLMHLIANLIGLFLIQSIFGRMISVSGWLFALLFAAPVAHAAVLMAGHFSWVAGLSTALHAVVGYAAISLLMDEELTARPAGLVDRPLKWRRNALFALLVCAGLCVKLLIDAFWEARWVEASARTAASLHAIAAALGAMGAILSCGPGRWTRPIQFRH